MLLEATPSTPDPSAPGEALTLYVEQLADGLWQVYGVRAASSEEVSKDCSWQEWQAYAAKWPNSLGHTVVKIRDRAAALAAILSRIADPDPAAEIERLKARNAELETEVVRSRGDVGAVLIACRPGKWQTREIIEAVPSLTTKEVYNVIGFLVRSGRAKRLRYGVLEILPAARTLTKSEPDYA